MSRATKYDQPSSAHPAPAPSYIRINWTKLALALSGPTLCATGLVLLMLNVGSAILDAIILLAGLLVLAFTVGFGPSPRQQPVRSVRA